MKQHTIIAMGVLLLALSGCANQSSQADDGDTSPDSVGSDSGPREPVPPLPSDSDSGSKQKVDANGIPVFDDCPVVQAKDACADGWCRIEPGTFLYGTPEEAGVPCSTGYNEWPPVQVTLTRPFLMQQYEVTQAQWEAMGFPNPARDVHPDKPITWINWFEALAYCNALSEKEGLDTCYDLSGCQGEVGTGCPTGSWFYDNGCVEKHDNHDEFVPGLYFAFGEVHKYPRRYDCPGYRLPTGSEWQYAARACTSAATYNGDISPELRIGGCEQEPVLDPIAWHCGNADALQVVKTRKPNLWHLYDMLGNAMEWTDQQNVGLWREYDEGTSGPLTDPIGHSETAPDGVFFKAPAGGSFLMGTCLNRPAYLFQDIALGRSSSVGFRPVRTILPPASPKKGK